MITTSCFTIISSLLHWILCCATMTDSRLIDSGKCSQSNCRTWQLHCVIDLACMETTAVFDYADFETFFFFFFFFFTCAIKFLQEFIPQCTPYCRFYWFYFHAWLIMFVILSMFSLSMCCFSACSQQCDVRQKHQLKKKS